MKSILNESEKNQLIGRINKLTSLTKPVCGTMSVSQMLAHCTVSVRLALQEIVPEKNETLLRLGKIVKDKIFETEIFSKNLPTSKEFLVSDNKEFDKNKNTLIEYLNRYSGIDINAELKASHPHLGELTINEWGLLIWKHTNHHLTQFGV